MSENNAVIDRYVSLWNEPDPARRRAILAKTFVEDATYLGPVLNAEGQEGLAELMTEVQTRFPGHTFHRTSAVDRHHDVVRYSWEILPAEGSETFAEGVDIGKLAPDGRIESVTVFIDKVPAIFQTHH